MASIYKRGKYLWLTWYQDGRVFCKSLKLLDTKQNRKLAQEIKLQKELELKRKQFAKATNNINLSDCIFHFLHSKKLLNDSRTLYKSAFSHFIKFLKNDPFIKNITQKDLINFSIYLQNQNKSEVTIQTYLNHLNIFFKWCCNNNYIDKLIGYKIKTSKKQPRIISDLHLHKILWYLRIHNIEQYKLIKFLVLTGFRKSEALNITYNDIDFERNLIYINNTKAKRTDLFPIYDKLKNFLLKYFNKNKGKLFNYSKDGLKFWNRTLIKLNLPKYSIHDLRRKFGTNLAEKGLTPYELQKLMRHQNIRTTMQYYVNIDLQSISKKM